LIYNPGIIFPEWNEMTPELTVFAESLARWNLLNHPFYQAWSAGTLPTTALAEYARDWGSFVRVIDRAWETVGQHEYAAEERVHAELWDDFAAALGTQAVDSAGIPALAQLRATAERLFTASEASALGALYAFEQQQPGTSTSKLAGLRAHYSLESKAEYYFAVHQDDYAEARWIEQAIGQLSAGDRKVAEAACEELCQALWDGLSGIYSQDCAMA
jgi:pyrroloquinoline-quinone synthase